MRRTLMILVAASAALCAGAPTSRAAAPAVGSVAYTANEAGDSVTVIDLVTGAPIGADIPVGDAPYGIALSPDGGTLYVSHAGSAPALQFVSTATRTVVQSVPLSAGSPRDVAVTPDGAKVYVALHAANKVSVIDVATHAETTVVSVPTRLPETTSGASALAMTPDGAKVYVVNDVESSVSVIATATDSVRRLPFPLNGPVALPTFRARVSPDGDNLVIVGRGYVVVVPTATDDVSVAPSGALGSQGDVAIVGRFAYVANSAFAYNGDVGLPPAPVQDGDASIDIYDLSSKAYVTSFAVGRGFQATSIVASPDGSQAWVAGVAGTGSLHGIDLAGRTTSGAAIPTGADPRTVVARFAQAPASSYFLPKLIRVKLKGAGKDSLTATGVFDEGAGAPDYSQPTTVTVAGFARTVTLSRLRPTLWRFKDATMKLEVRPPKTGGSSRGSWALTATNETLAGLVPTDGVVDLSFAVSGLATATARTRLAAGAFALGRRRGTLLAPAFFPSAVRVVLADGKPDLVSVKGGFADNGTTPAALGDVTFAVGPDFVESIAGASFVKEGDVFRHSRKFPGGRVSAVVDFARGTASLTTTGVEAGPLSGPATDVLFDVGLAAGAARVTVRLAAARSKRTY